MNKKINTVGLFSGGGGLDLGFSASGYNVVYSSDIDSYSCKTLENNQGKKRFLKKHIVECADINNLTGADILAKTGEQVDFVIGGPPCQSFSVFGKRKGLDDPRGNLIFEYTRIIKELNPRGFLFENSRFKDYSWWLYSSLLETVTEW
jgi:DNA (cytosine-5)-methyltransferase 1